MNYQISKTVRFKLEPIEKNTFEKIIKDLANEKTDDFEAYNLFSNFIQDFEKLFFYKENELSKHIYIKKQWVKDYAKDYFYTDNTENRQFPVNDFKEEMIYNWIRLKETINFFGKTISKDQHDKSRKSILALIVKKLLIRKGFKLFCALVDNSVLKNDTENVLPKLYNKTQQILAILKQLEKKYLPAQSKGIVLTKASFNYYTIHKKPVDFQTEINKLTKENIISEKVVNKTCFDIFKTKIDKNSLYKLFENQIVNKKLLLYKDEENKIENEIGLLNLLKAKIEKEKKEFNEFIQAKGSYEALAKANLDLFKTISIQDFNEYIQLSNQIENLATKINNTNKDDEKKSLKDKLKDKKQKRGQLLQLGKETKKFTTYKNYAEFYGKVAQKYGIIKARLKGIEKEQAESQLLNYWSVLVEENDKHYLALIPKEKDFAQTLKATLKENKNTNQTSKIFWFESMTFRALQKLCFGYVENNTHSNTFYEGIKNEFDIQKKYRKQVFDKEAKQFKDSPYFIKGEFDLNGNEKKKIRFYKDVLKSEYAKKVLSLPFDEIESNIVNQDFETLDDFKLALQKICYKKFASFNENAIQYLSKNFNAIVFEITSKDIRKDEKVNLNNHTEIWFDFWSKTNESNNYVTRLNPEISITWREAKQSRIDKYGPNSDLFNPKMNNRYLHPQFTLITTMSLNAQSHDYRQSFNDLEKQKNNIINFNKNFPISNYQYAMGIDTNNIELAVLSIAKKTENNQLIPQKITVYEIKDIHYEKIGWLDNNGNPIKRETPYKISLSPQLFVDKKLYEKTFRENNFEEMFEKLFEKKEVNGLDLTRAKLVSGKIIINADIKTRLILYKLNAKRKIYQTLIKNPALKLEEENYNFKLDDEIIYRSNQEFNCIQTYDEVKNEIYTYFDEKQKDEARTEEKINHYRKAMTANMVGIIQHLYEQYPAHIAIEDLKASKIEGDRKKIEYHIARPLEWAIIKKMQSNCLIPHINEYLKLKEDEKTSLKQFGILKFVDHVNTSNTCPKCNKKGYDTKDTKKYPDNEENIRYLADKERKLFNCNKCDYDSKDNPNVYQFSSNDEIAAYNVAVKTFKS
jgi:hypothetical protein